MRANFEPTASERPAGIERSASDGFALVLGQGIGKLWFFAWVVFCIHLKSLGLTLVDKLDNGVLLG
jgi:hypothetical protein